uniref:Uncharacterized protein LOC105648377 n=1 Tax=Rhizophora mucronata TaxID=61149 RepID=A0A2P2JKQ1_RHIMU
MTTTEGGSNGVPRLTDSRIKRVSVHWVAGRRRRWRSRPVRRNLRIVQ